MSKKQLELYIEDIKNHLLNREEDKDEIMKRVNDKYYSELSSLYAQYKGMLDERK